MYRVKFLTRNGEFTKEYESLDVVANAVASTTDLVFYRCWQITKRSVKKNKFEKKLKFQKKTADTPL